MAGWCSYSRATWRVAVRVSSISRQWVEAGGRARVCSNEALAPSSAPLVGRCERAGTRVLEERPMGGFSSLAPR